MLHIPAYVYVLLCVLIYVGIKRCYPRVTQPQRTIVFPIVLILFGATSLRKLFPLAGLGAYVGASTTLTCGALLGWLHARRWRLSFETHNGAIRVRLPGDPSLLVTLLASFFAEFVMHFAVLSEQPWAATNAFILCSFGIWGVLGGMPLGRASNVLARCMRAAST